MKRAFGKFTINLTALLVLTSLGCAQERGTENRSEGNQGSQSKVDRSPRRLESVTWNSNNHELSWVISKGERDNNNGYKPTTTNTYLINMEKATMTFNGETRRFSKQEAVNVHALMDLVAKYAVESTIWWDQGNGRRNGEGDGSGVARVSTEKPGKSTTEELLLRLELLERRLESLENDLPPAGQSGKVPALHIVNKH